MCVSAHTDRSGVGDDTSRAYSVLKVCQAASNSGFAFDALLKAMGMRGLRKTNLLESQVNRLAVKELEKAQRRPESNALFEIGSAAECQQVATLIQWMAKGDESAFNLFYDATKGLIFGLLLRILGHTQTAEEVMSELYEEIRRRAGRFGKQNERPLTWLILIVHRRAIDRLCSKLTTQIKISRRINGNPEPTNISNSVINITEQRRLIRAALDAIPHIQRQMIELTFFSGMTHLEIAMKLGQPPEAVEHGIRYGMLQLLGLFKSMGFSYGPKTGI
jgi:RNA polymerase sigma-70 factor, ECF subfamily